MRKNLRMQQLAAFQRIAGASLAMLLALSALHPQARAENWTRFRGPNGSGIARDANFPATWTDDDYAWKIKLPGIGHSSPVGWEKQIFITSGNTETGEVTLHGLDATTGDQQWERKFAGQPHKMHAGNSYASTTPALDAQHLYFTWSSGGAMHCAALTHEGQDVWQTELGEFAGPHGFAASPMVVDGVVCAQVDHADGGFLVGIDAKSGAVRWRAERPGGKASYATPCAVKLTTGETVVISQSMAGGAQAIDVQTGKVVWEDPEAFPARCVSSPINIDGLVIGICGGGGNGKLLVGLDFSESQQPLEKLVLKKQLPYVSTPLVLDQRLYLWHDQGKVSMAEIGGATPPKKVSWTERIGGKYYGSPIVAGDKIYCLSMEGRAVVIAASDEFELLGDNDLGEPSHATPAVHQGRLYLRTESTLACLAAQ